MARTKHFARKRVRVEEEEKEDANLVARREAQKLKRLEKQRAKKESLGLWESAASRNVAWKGRLEVVTRCVKGAIPSLVPEHLYSLIAAYGTDFCPDKLDVIISGCGLNDRMFCVAYYVALSVLMDCDRDENQPGKFKYVLADVGAEPAPRTGIVADLWKGKLSAVNLFRRRQA